MAPAGRLAPVWTWLSVSAGLLAFTGSALGLLQPAAVYGRETEELLNAALAQDAVNALLVSPLLVVLALLARRGSVMSWLTLTGFLGFTVYNYSIYAFSLQFGPLFLVWVAVLGLSVFALAGSLAGAGPAVADTAGTPGRLTGWILIATSVFFTLLWLREIIPDLLAGSPSSSASLWNVPTNPVHVLDLALYLPGVLISGVLVLRGRAWGWATAAGSLAFLGLTALPILVTPVVALLRGSPPGWPVALPMGLLSLILWAAFFRQLRLTRRTLRTGPRGAGPRGADSGKTARR